ncbi:MAG: response regulator [SAR324 cluster bacterium]|nr:response regulator [SAR324 cluster bacterium]MBF0349710.1 response regulator [SAR324 cluster bacterium]
MKLMIVDDEPSIQELFAVVLGDEHKLVFADDGEKAWEIFLESPFSFDGIITDVNMPNMDGCQLVECIRKHRYDIPVVAMSSGTTLIQQTFLSGWDVLKLLPKPFHYGDLEIALSLIAEKSSRDLWRTWGVIEGEYEYEQS